MQIKDTRMQYNSNIDYSGFVLDTDLGSVELVVDEHGEVWIETRLETPLSKEEFLELMGQVYLRAKIRNYKK